MDWTIRRATPGTAPIVREVARESWHAAYDEILGRERVTRITDEWYALDDLEDSIATATDRDDVTFLVAIADDSDRPNETTHVGFAHAGVTDDPDTAVLTRLYVRPDRWGDGAGTALLERVERDLESVADRLRLVVLADNDVGISFYESAGFERLETRPSDIGEGIAECVYEKRLVDSSR